MPSPALPPTSAPRATRLLSIGLHAEAPAPLNPEAPPGVRGALLELADGRRVDLNASVCNIGSAPDATIQLSDPNVSSLHAQIKEYHGALFLRDAGSFGGTWVNGAPLSNAHELRHGDRISIGRSQLLFAWPLQAPQAAAELGAPASPASALPRLELRSGSAHGLCFVLTGEVQTLGSAAEASIRLVDASVAPQHARLRTEHDLHYLSDLGSPAGTYARGIRLVPGQEIVLSEGELFQLGALVLLYTRAPLGDRLSALRAGARIVITSGPASGNAAALGPRAVIGAASDAHIRLPASSPHELEIIRHGPSHFVRDLSGGRTFKSGQPLGRDWAPLADGELLLASNGALLRFEET
jgi:pSer/pThr/pTyr-binding forkhead associated (FHA) protein